MHIVYISDGKAGHRSQALGLYQAMQRQSAAKVTFQEISLEQLPLLGLVGGLFSKKISVITQVPDFIFGVGSHTHIPVLLLGKIYPEAKTVILMRPSLPMSWFDYAVVPEHDGIAASERVIVTKGALNPLVNERCHQKDLSLILLGGSSKRHRWNTEKILASISRLIRNNPEQHFRLTTSRRTPADFLQQLSLQTYVGRIEIYPVEQTAQGWLFEQLQQVENVWVTEDSISMLYEALTAGCRVGVLDIDCVQEDRITQSVASLVQQGFISPTLYAEHLPKAHALKEAERVATLLLSK